MMLAVPGYTDVCLIALLCALTGCRQAPQPRVEVKQQEVAVVSSGPSIAVPGVSTTEPEEFCGLQAYPMPRSYPQILADAPPGSRKTTTSLYAKVAIDREGNITHLRFLRLSTLDSINRYAIENLKRQHYKPTVLDGERVSGCSTVSINVDLSN
jgi:hypothetical protein